MNTHLLFYDAGAALIAWSETYNLTGKGCVSDRAAPIGRPEPTLQHRCWPILTALQTILFWQFHPSGSRWELSDPPRWCPPVLTLQEPVPEPEVLPPIQLRVSVQIPVSKKLREVEAPGWYMGLETELQFRGRMGEAFNRWMDSYIAGRRESAHAAGLEQTPGKQKLVLHFTWAAKYQIGKISPPKLALEYHVKTDTVKVGIHGALELIHLKRRPPQRGGLKGTHR
jgi:hypothetical protein